MKETPAETHPTAQGDITPVLDEIDRILSEMPPITLEQMKVIKLMNRIDKKYIVNVEQLPVILRMAQGDYYVQETDGLRRFMQGASVGGGNILVNQIDGMNVEFNGENSTILVTHWDKPGVIAAVTQLMHWEYADLNISNFHLSRQSKGGEAIMTIEIDGQPPEDLIAAIRKIEHVSNAILIRRI